MTDRREIWVTGAGGFIGAAVCRRLLQEGHTVQPVVRSAIPEHALGDSREQVGLRPALLRDLAEERLEVDDQQPGPAAVVHLAAELPTSFDGAAAEGVAARNRRIDDNVFAFAVSTGADLVFASSGSVYGEGHGEVFIEDGPTHPRGPYAAAKLQSEQQGTALLGVVGGVAFAALRISAPYGPGQGTRTVVQHFLRQAMAGDDLSYHGSGSRMQDFVYVSDVADAVCGCLAARAAGAFNIASGAPVSMKELASVVAAIAGLPVAVAPSGRPDVEEGHTASYSVQAAERAFGWRPRTSLRRGLEQWRDHLSRGAS